MRTLPEVLIAVRGPDDFVISNALTRTHAVGDLAFIELLSALDDAERFRGRRFRVADAGASPYADGLLGDPTGLDRDARATETVDLDAALALIRRLQFAVEDLDAYRASFGPRRNVLDRARRGTLHQQVGEHVLLGLRKPSVDEWWADQKFAPGRREPREGPYRWVQWSFMERWAAEQALDGARVLDFGAGPGLFARLFAAHGATVVAVDTNAAHLESIGDGIETRVLQLPAEEHVPDGPFDLIFLSDVLMFYFHPYDPALALDPHALLRALAARLAPGGRIVVLEPDGTFWQQPWLGAPDRPFTILTEYRNRRFGVTPTLEEVSRAAEQAGLVIERVRQLVPDEEGEDRAHRFAAEFPLWWLFELAAR
jgi:SAM-dependent methyltransferase